MNKNKVTIFWFRRDLRLEDNHGLSKALSNNAQVLPIFIFDKNIIDELACDDARITFLYDVLKNLYCELKNISSCIYVLRGDPKEIWKQLLSEFDIEAVYINKDYEPYAIKRDREIKELLHQHDINLLAFKDQVIFEQEEVQKLDRTPYSVYTPYKNKWMSQFDSSIHLIQFSVNVSGFYKCQFEFPTLESLGFVRSSIQVKAFKLSRLQAYKNDRDFPARDNTSYLSPHLRHGTVSIREIIKKTLRHDQFINELIWREFFMQILYHFPQVVHSNFKRKYDFVTWRNNLVEFEKWKNGMTGYPIVDAGMRQLNTTGLMHNRVRMVVAGFLCKHLLIDWRWGEAYFAKKLLDYELSSNNGNWQWSSGTGCDAAPYFRIFNPTEQAKKFDRNFNYIRKWIPEIDTPDYPAPMVDHKIARERAIEVYKQGITKYNNT